MIERLAALAHGLGPMLACGSSLLLLVGAVAVALCRAPIHQQRIAELAMVGTVVWVALAVTPLPRWSLERSRPLTVAVRGVEHAEVPVAAGDRGTHRRTIGATPPTSPTSAPARVSERIGLAAAAADTALASDPHPDPSPQPAPGSGAVDHERDRLALSSSTARFGSGPRLDPWSVIAIVYLVGAALLLLRLALAFVGLRRLLQRGRPASPALTALVDALAAELGIAAPRLRVAPFGSPLCAGILRPTIVLPADLAASPFAPELRSVLRHELAHVRRRDGARRLMLALASPLLWPQPLLWWLRARALLAAELIADGEAVHGDSPLGYARTLLALSARDGRAVPVAISMSAPRSHLHRRITMLMKDSVTPATHDTVRARLWHGAAAAVLVLATAAVFGVRPAVAQEPEAAAGSRQLEQERARLRNEIDVLRHELDDLRAMVRQNAERASPSPEPVELRGRVTDGRGDPIRGATVAAPRGGVAVGRAGERASISSSSSPVAVRSRAPVEAEPLTTSVAAGAARGILGGGAAKADDRGAASARALSANGQAPSEPVLQDAEPTASTPEEAMTRVQTAPVRVRSMPPRQTPPVAQPAPVEAPSAPAPGSSDTISNLALALIDARGDLRRAQLSMEAAALASEAGAVDRVTLARAKIDVDVAQQRTNMLQQLLAGEQQALEMQMVYVQQEVERGQALAEKGFVPKTEVLRQEAELRRLKVQLDTVRDLLR